MDQLQRALSDRYGLRFIYADVSDSASVLTDRHLAGPIAASVLSQALVAVALVSSDLENEGEAISIQWKVNGPIGGILVEALYGGGLRGYTYRKTLGDLDDAAAPDPAGSLGTDGHMTVLHSMPRQVLYTGIVAATPPDIQRNLARYYNQSRQTPTAVAIRVDVEEGRPRRARGVIAQKLPDASTEKFVEVLERFDDETVDRALASAAGIADIGPSATVEDLVVVGSSLLAFACRCSRERVTAVLAMLPTSDLEEMAAEDKPQTVVCHFCGEAYVVGRQEIARLLETRGKGQ